MFSYFHLPGCIWIILHGMVWIASWAWQHWGAWVGRYVVCSYFHSISWALNTQLYLELEESQKEESLFIDLLLY